MATITNITANIGASRCWMWLTPDDPDILFNARADKVTLYGNGPEKTDVITGCISTTRLTVSVRAPDLSGDSPTLTARATSGIEFTTESATISDDVVTFVVLANANGRVTPWSIHEDLQWAMSDNNETINVGTTPLEIYGLFEALPDYLLNNLPARLLRLFLPPAQTAGIHTEQQWVEWVARVCHGTQDPKQPYGALRETSENHWLKYQVWNGAYSFVGDTGASFHLLAWLDAYDNWVKDNDYITCVNCYDQAGITEIVLSLGMHYERLWWFYVRPYGYIQTTDLVGWGLTNNPYFDGDNQLKIVDPAAVERSPFRNHAFIMITPEPHQYNKRLPYKGEGGVVVDACAGPHCGTESLEEYLQAATDKKGDSEWEDDAGEERSFGTRGVTDYDNQDDTLALAEKMRQMSPSQVLKEMEWVVEKIQTAWPENKKLPDSFDTKAPLNVCDKLLEECKFTNQNEKPIAPVKNTFERKWQVADGGYKADGTYVRKSWSFVSFKVTKCETVEAATVVFQNRASLFTPPPKQNHKIIGVKTNSVMGITNKNIYVLGNGHLSLFVYKNLVVEINGNESMKFMNGFTSGFVDELMRLDSTGQ